MNPRRLSRRDVLKGLSSGFGYLAFAGLSSMAAGAGSKVSPLAPKAPHFPARARRVIFLCMNGAPSHVDTFDYKPELSSADGKVSDRPGRIIEDEEIKRKFSTALPYRQWLDEHLADGKLFDMITDPGQLKDVTKEQPDEVKRLTQAVADYRRDVIAGMLKKDDRPFTVGYPEFPTTYLPARDGEPHGNVKRSARAPNCSYFTNWTTTDDRITWIVEVNAAGRY